MIRLRPRTLVLALGIAAASVGCGASGASGAGGRSDAPVDGAGGGDVARIHRTRCGACHVRVEPGQRTRAQLEKALARHHRRVTMTDAQWREMIDYLASDAPADAATGGAVR